MDITRPAVRFRGRSVPWRESFRDIMFGGCVGACHDSGGPLAHPLEVVGEGWRADLGMANLLGPFIEPHACFHDGSCPARLDVVGC